MNGQTNIVNDVLEQLTIPQIASWQVPETVNQDPIVIATLPALQRGFIWKPKQIENLWDSLMRGFPLGSFLVAPFEEGRLGKQDMKYAQDDGGRQPTHYLLDGQQRATAIALGFIDPTLHINSAATLWLDIDPKIDQADEREFVFRVITEFHPWGFSRTNAENRLEVRKIRDAFDGFKEAAKQSSMKEDLHKSPSKFHLMYTWPWDTFAPVPVAFLWNVNAREDILPKLEKLPYWNSQCPPSWKDKVNAAIIGKDIDLAERLDDVIKRFHELRTYEVPVLTVPMSAKASTNDRDSSNRPDHIETLFVRVNSGGTKLEGEELVYSILKSECPEVTQFVDNMKHRISSPARTVMLASRLILARKQQKDNLEKQPPIPDVSMFRRLLRGTDKMYPEFKNDLCNAINAIQDVPMVFEIGYNFLTMAYPLESTEQFDYRLHPYLVADMAGGVKGHDVLILFLRWIDRLRETGVSPLDLDELTKRRSLGFIVVLAWFGYDTRECVRRLWHDLQICDATELRYFFNANRFKTLISRKEDEGIILIPPISSDVFTSSLFDLCNKIEKTELDDNNTSYWKNRWEFYQTFKKEALTNWVKKTIYPLWHETLRHDDMADVAWWIDYIWDNRKFVIYAQRNWLREWFPDYDPTIPGAADTNRPWDYDHIHPNNFIVGRHKMPDFLRHLHWCNGNFRAWPLEANRSVHDEIPNIKLKSLSTHEERYNLNASNLLHASFITDEESDMWCKSVPVKDLNNKYLACPKECKEFRESHIALVRAIAQRLGRIYAEWFKSLAIADLLPKSTEQ